MENACADGRLTLIRFLLSPPAPPGLRGVLVVAVLCCAAPRWREAHMWLDSLPASAVFDLAAPRSTRPVNSENSKLNPINSVKSACGIWEKFVRWSRGK